MKKVLVASFVLGIAVSLLLVPVTVSAASHDYSTTFNTSWTGSGTFDGTFASGDDLFAQVHTGGSTIFGTWSGTDNNDNPYNYGVDTSFTQLVAGFGGGGFITFGTDRTDSTGMYGNPGQWMYSSVGSSDGSGEMAKFEWVNYAAQNSCNYGKPRTSGGDHFEATGSDYGIYTELDNGAGEWSYVSLQGQGGGAYLDLMNSGIWGDTSYQLGRGCGCYTDSDWQFTGTTAFIFEREAWADNSVTIHNDGTTIPGTPANQAHYYELIQGAGTYGENDMSMSGN